jgi:hypothetical protein
MLYLPQQAPLARLVKQQVLAVKDLAGFSNDFTALASDLASFNNTTPEQAVQAIGAALRGESEPLRQYGVLLNDAALKAAALELGIYDGSGALTDQQKILAAQKVIFEQTTDAQGDFARTSDGLANSQRTLTAQMDNLQVSIGQALLPVVEAILPLSTKVCCMGRRQPKHIPDYCWCNRCSCRRNHRYKHCHGT